MRDTVFNWSLRHGEGDYLKPLATGRERLFHGSHERKKRWSKYEKIPYNFGGI
jgi:hypothetical protein